MGLCLLGFLAGFGSAFLGIGGGVILVPALVLVFHYDIKRSLGTSLATIVPAALAGAVTHYFIDHGNISFGQALFILPGALLGVWGGAYIAKRLHGKYLKILFALLLIFVGLKLTGMLDISVGEASRGIDHYFLAVMGLFAGLSSALFGIGGGIIMVPALNLVFGFPMHEAVGTSLAVIVPISLAGALLHGRYGNIESSALPKLIPSSLAGAVAGAFISNVTSPDIIKVTFGVFLILVAVKMMMTKRG